MENEIKDKLYDAVIVGGGPAGLTAALYLARARYRVVVIEKEHFGGQITITNEVVNYPGVAKTSGKALTETMRAQAESFGAEFLLAEVIGFEESQGIKIVKTTKDEIPCYSILLAVGSAPRMIGFPGEEEFRGRGVAYCATCDGELFTGKDVFVIGGGYAAAEESVFLTRYAKHVHIMFRKGDFSCAPAASEAARSHEKITIHPYTVVEELVGDAMPQILRYKNTQTGEVHEYKAEQGDMFGVFVLAGYCPATGWLKGLVDLTESGNIVTNSAQQTSIEGIFAAGDVCVKELRQVVTATGEAASTATQMERYIAKMQKKIGIVPKQLRNSENEPDTSQTKDSISDSTDENQASNASELSSNFSNTIFDEDMISQLSFVFARMENPLILKLYLNNEAVSEELKYYCNELANLTDKISVEEVISGSDEFHNSLDETSQASKESVSMTHNKALPCVQVCSADGTYTGLAFHGVPGGHEFTSFVLGLYNTAGPGQPLDDADLSSVNSIQNPVDIKVLVSLSCTMCPDTVMACQRIASINPNVTAEVFDLNLFPEIKDQYQVMSVPCIVVNDGETVSFGKKNIQQVMELLH